MGTRQAPGCDVASHDAKPDEARLLRLRLVDSAALLPDRLARRRHARRVMVRALALLAQAGPGASDHAGRRP